MTDERLNAVLAEYLEAEDAGHAPDRREFVAGHPEVAAELEAFFANQDEFDSRAEPLGPVRQAAASSNGERPRPFWRSPVQNASVSAASEPAARRFGDYELLDEIARGGMGVVYKARHIGLGRVVGLKMILAGPLASPGDLDRFRIEAQATAMLDHPNIVPTYEVGECDGQPFFTMKLVEGRSLADRLADWKNDSRAVARIIAKITRAVHYAHQRGVLHRDLKPANILLDTAGEPHVTDFGLAKYLHSPSELTQTGAVLGTPSYMAPEQAAGSRQPITTGADVYSLGAILYAMITGRPPFRAETPVETLRQVTEHEPEPPSRINRRMDRDLETICLKCLEKDPRRRYGSAEALADDLDRWLSNSPIHARRTGGWERTLKWARRNPAAASLVAVSSLGVLFVLVGSLWYNQRLRVEIGNAERERLRAEANFEKARDAVDHYFTLVSENTLLELPQLHSLREELLKAALRYHQDFLRERSDDRGVRIDLAASYMRLGQIYAALDRNDDAIAALQQGLDLAQKLSQDPQFAPEIRRRLAGIHRGDQGIHRGTNPPSNPLAALMTLQQGATLWESFVQQEPTATEFQHDLAAFYVHIGGLRTAMGSRDAGMESFEKARDIWDKLYCEHPAVPEYRAGLSFCYGMIGRHLARKRQSELAAQSFRQAWELIEQLAADFPNVPKYQLELANNYGEAGSELIRNQQLDQAEEMYRKALSISEHLASEYSSVPVYQETLAIGHYNLANLLMRQDRPQEAEPAYRSAMLLIEKLASNFPDAPHYNDRLAEYCRTSSVNLLTLGKLADAEQVFRKALPAAQRLADAYPANLNYRSALAHDSVVLGNRFHDAERHDEAIAAYRQAVVDGEALLHDFPDDHRAYERFAWFWIGCADPTFRDSARAVELASKAVELEPNDGDTWQALGAAQCRAGNWKAAIESLTRASELRHGKDSFNWFFLAMAHWQLGDREQAVAWYTKAVDWMKKNKPFQEDLRRFHAEAAAVLGMPE